MSKKNQIQSSSFTGTTVAIRDCGKDNLFQLLLLEIKDGVIVSQIELTNPDAPSIVIAKAESVLWAIRGDHSIQ